MTEIAIRVENLSKRYRIGKTQARYRTLRETLMDVLQAPIDRLRDRRGDDGSNQDFVWALKDVSLEVRRGEVVGIIGRNGAGKTTLLKILSRITEPTNGYADIYGRVGTLLEVGTGFHPELTGRENIYLNGAILGMRKVEIERKFDEIVGFAEVSRFIDTPVKFYSSGMYVRLAFAVAAHLEPEILLVDEVLAVGDAAFQTKCLGKMSDVAQEGRTVLFVSHNMGAVRQLCKRVVLLDEGTLDFEGDAPSAIDHYLRTDTDVTGLGSLEIAASTRRWGNGRGRITRVEFEDEEGTSTASFGIGEPFLIRFYAYAFEGLPGLVVGAKVLSATGIPLLNLRSDSQGIIFNPCNAGDIVEFVIKVPGLPFYPGIYRVEPWFKERNGDVVDKLEGGISIKLESKGRYQSEKLIQEGRGIVAMDCEWRSKIVTNDQELDNGIST